MEFNILSLFTICLFEMYPTKIKKKTSLNLFVIAQFISPQIHVI